MLERGTKGKGYFKDLQTKPEYEQVNPLRSRQERKSMSAAEYAEFESDTFTKMDKAVERFLKSSQPIEWARINDMVLRAVLRVPDEVRRDTRAFGNFYEKLRKRAALTLANRKNSVMLDHEDRAKLEVAAKKLAENLDSLESSVTQLVSLMDMRAKENPNVTFATSVDLDVRYGIDLMELGTHFDEAKGAIVADIRTYQAKARRGGLTNTQIQEEARRYEDRRHMIETEGHVVLDPEWIVRVLRENRPEMQEAPEVSEEALFDALAEGLATITQANKAQESESPYNKYAAQLRMWQGAEALAGQLGVKNSFKKPAVELGSLEMNYAFDTAKGLEILTPIEALTYGQNPTSGRPAKTGSEASLAAK